MRPHTPVRRTLWIRTQSQLPPQSLPLSMGRLESFVFRLLLFMWISFESSLHVLIPSSPVLTPPSIRNPESTSESDSDSSAGGLSLRASTSSRVGSRAHRSTSPLEIVSCCLNLSMSSALCYSVSKQFQTRTDRDCQEKRGHSFWVLSDVIADSPRFLAW